MNTIYTNFLKAYLQQGISLAGPNADEFKIALFTESYTPDNDDKKYSDLVKAGYEVQGLGYRSGGKTITFNDPTEDDGRINFLGSNVIWTKATFIARYGVIYRVSDGLLVSCYDFGMNQSVEDGKFNLSWKGTSTISISIADLTEQAKALDVDSVLSLTSSNPVENKVLTDIFRSLGVKIGRESIPSSAECIDEDIDTINEVSHRDIDSLFGIYHRVTVHFDTQAHGENPGDITVERGTKFVLPNVTYVGCIFVAWYSDPSCDESYYVGKALDYVSFDQEGEVTLYAKWDVINYIISFEVNNHGIKPDAVPGVYGDTFALPQVECSTHTLIQWCSDALCTEYVGAPGDIYTITSSAILYAKWEINIYDVVFHTDGGSEIETQHIPAGSKAIQPINPVKHGYVFVEWCSDPELLHPYSFTSSVYADTNLYAKWGSQLYTLTWEPQNTQSSFTTQQYYLTNIVLPPVPEFGGYTFLGWFTEPEGGTQVTSSMKVTENATYYAQWRSNWYTTTFDNNGVGADIPPITAELGSVFYLPGPIALGYTFDGWYRDAACTSFVGNRGAEFTVRGNTTLYAKWNINIQRVTWMYQNSNSDSDYSWVSDVRTVNYGSAVEIPADLESYVITYTNYYVEGWYTEKIGGDKVTPSTRITSDVTFWAHRKPQSYTVTFDNNGHGDVCEPITQEYNNYITLPYNYADGYHFDGWYLETAHVGNGGDPYKVTGNVTLYAKWVLNVYTITFDSNGGTAVENQYVPYLSLVERPANPVKTDYVLDEWCTDARLLVPYDFNAPVVSSFTLYARWIPTPIYTVTFVSDPIHGPAPEPVVRPWHSVINLPTVLQTGWTLTGWYDENQIFIGVPGSSYTISRDITLTATWSRNTYTLVWSALNGDPDLLTYKKYEEYVTLPSELDPPYNPTYIGHTFNNWYTMPSGGEIVTDNTQVFGSMNFFAHWITNEYTLIWVNNNVVYDTTTQLYGTSIILPEDPTPATTGDIFRGWYDDNGNRITAETPVPAANTQYRAYWNRLYTVTYSANGHGVAPDPVSQEDGSVIILANIITEGYTLVGWYDNPECTGTMIGAPGEGYTGSENIILYAKWAVQTITITWDNWADGTNITTTAQSYGTTIQFPANPTPPTTGDIFRGWVDEHGDAIPSELVIRRALTCYGKWERWYTITYFNNGHGQLPDPVTRPDNTPVILPTISAEDRTFVGWYVDNIRDEQHFAGNGGDSYRNVNNVDLYAQWDTRFCTILWNSMGGTPIESTSQRAEELLILPEEPTREHYTFNGWWTEIVGGTQVDGTTEVPNTYSVEYFAHWTADSYTITWMNDSSVFTTTSQGWNTNLILPMNPDPAPGSGDTFVGWFTEPDPDGVQVDSSVIVVADVTYYAHWQRYYTVTFVSEYGGTPSPITRRDGETINLPTAASMIATGLDFDRWYTTSTFDPGTDVPFVYTGSVNVTLYAHWVPRTPATLTYDYNGVLTAPSKNMQPESIACYVGDTLYLKAPNLPLGYTFLGWYKEASAVTKAGDAGDSYTVESVNDKLYASFTYNAVVANLYFIDVLADRGGGFENYYGIGYQDVSSGTATSIASYPASAVIRKEDTPHSSSELGWSPIAVDDISTMQNTLTTVELKISEPIVPDSAFRNYTVLSEVVIPNAITDIADNAFNGITTLKNVFLGENVSSIGAGAFAGCTGIERYEIKALTPPFIETTSLAVNNNTKIYVPAEALQAYLNNSNWSVYASHIYTRVKVDFSDMRSNSSTQYCIGYEDTSNNPITFPVAREVQTIKNTYEGSDFGWQPVLTATPADYKSTLRYCEVPTSVTSLAASAFASYPLLEVFVFSNTITDIGTGLFADCNNLRKVIISTSLGSLDDNIFVNCRKLTEIVVPANITAIGRYAFEGCGLLSVYEFKSLTPPSIYDTSIFIGNSNNIVIYVPNAAREAYVQSADWNRYSSIIRGK